MNKYMIMRDDGLFWNGKRFVSLRRDAKVFESEVDVFNDLKAIMLSMDNDCSRMRLEIQKYNPNPKHKLWKAKKK